MTGATVSFTTQTAGNSTTAPATTAFVGTAITNLKTANNTWTGTQGMTGATVSFLTQSSLNNTTAPATTAFVATAISNLKSTANTWTQSQDFTGSVILVPTKVATDGSTAAASTAFVGTAISNIKGGTTWTGTHNFTGATINALTQVSTDNSTKVATTAFVKVNSGISGILTGNNTYTGNNIFDLGLKFGGSTGTTQILITSDTIKSSLSNDTVNLFNTNTSGQINMASNLIFKASNILSSGAGDTINLFNTNTTGQINMASNLIFKASNILSSGAGNTINLFNNLTSGTLNIGGTGKVAIGATVYVAQTQSNINYNLGGGGAVRTITIPSAGVFMYVFGANYNDANITATTFVSAGSSTCRLFNLYAPPGFSYSLTPTGNQTFTISAGFPSTFNTFSVSFIKLG
jgi:hypothetical protein